MKGLRKYVRNLLKENFLDEEYPKSFDMEHFKTLKTFVQRIGYCKDHLQRMAAGSSRIVFKIDDEKVLKLASNAKGIAQNETEINYGSYGDITDVIARVFDHEENNLWVEMELAKKVTEGEFKRISGFSFRDYAAAVNNYGNDVHGKRNGHVMAVDKKLVEQMWESEFTYRIFDFIGNYGLPVGDLMRLSSYGIVKRDGADTIVLVDFGLTEEVHATHYARERKVYEEDLEGGKEKLNKYLYHAASNFNRERIEKNGIVPHRGEQWLSDTKIEGNAVFATNSDNPEDWFDSTYDDDVWRIDTRKIPDVKWFIDPNFGKTHKHIYTKSAIPRSAIELIKKGTGEDLLETRNIKNEKYANCHTSDLMRMDIIQEFLNQVEKDPEYNTEAPDLDWLMDPYGGYSDQSYIQNNLDNGQIIFWEGWSSFCWQGLYSKTEYKGIKKEDALKKIFRERTPRIAQEFGMTIENADFFWHDAQDDDAENGYIMKIVFKKDDIVAESSFSDDYDFSKHNFNHGDCDIYAVSLHRLYGYPLCVVRGWFLEEEWGGEREWDYEDAHIMVKLPNGKYMDSSGESTEEDMKSLSAFGNKIEKITIEHITEEQALSTFSCENQEPAIKQVMNFIKKKKGQPLDEAENNIWMQGGLILIKGEKTEGGTQKLFATHIENLSQHGRIKVDNTPGKSANMVTLTGELYRLVSEDGGLKTYRVDWNNEKSLTKSLKFYGQRYHVVLNNNKTPLHWETLKYRYMPEVVNKLQHEILGIPNIKWSLK